MNYLQIMPTNEPVSEFNMGLAFAILIAFVALILLFNRSKAIENRVGKRKG